MRWIWPSVLPLFFAGIGILFYNWLRFGNLLDFGYLTENVAPSLHNDLMRYGQFNVSYLTRNLWTLFLAPPLWNVQSFTFLPDSMGMSLFITTPALVFLVKARQRSPVVLGAWLSVILLLIPLLLYYNTGWFQFGYRFSLDFMVPIMVLLAFAVQERIQIGMQVLILISVAINAWGTRWFIG